MKHQRRNELKQRVATGFWIDKDNNGHVSIKELLDMVGLPDTPENKKQVVQMLVSTGRIEGSALYREKGDDTYAISVDGKSIVCLKCEKRSYNPADVHNKYCGHCHLFHENR